MHHKVTPCCFAAVVQPVEMLNTHKSLSERINARRFSELVALYSAAGKRDEREREREREREKDGADREAETGLCA